MLIFDAHLDLSMNAVQWNRDLTREAAEIRATESGQTDKPDRGRGTVTLAEMRRGEIGLCVATQIARGAPGKSLLAQIPGFASPEIAWAMTQGQLAWYRAMEEAGEMVQIRDLAGLDSHLALWQGAGWPGLSAARPGDAADEATVGGESFRRHPDGRASSVGEGIRLPQTAVGTTLRLGPATRRKPIGYILSLEGADSILTPRHLERAYGQGLRAIGPAHYGPGRYANGTHATGGLTPEGRELLAEMRRLGVILDATHLCDDSFWEALDVFDGPVWASHNNCRALVPGDRQFSDEQIKALINRGGVIGAAFDAWMLHPGWERGKTTPQEAGVTLARIVDHIDHICQLAGNARHAAIGTDLDGGFGREQSPADLDTIADLQKFPALLASRGYSAEDVKNIVLGNWLRFLRTAWEDADDAE